ncbi:MAG: ATP-binding protein [Ferruginibacter sp.]|nr:ATP-binding protein [Ferruginibacter sp.]
MTAKPKKIKRIYVIYWVLLAYIIAALVWWFIALMQQNQIMVNIRKAELIKSDYNYDLKFKAIEEDRKRKVAQYVGEGSIFFLLIIAGAVFVFRAIRRQLKHSQQQQSFMMAITHELKTPIAVAKLNLETLLKHKLDENRQQRLLHNTLQEANRLNDLSNNLLFSSQIEAGGYMYHPEETDIAAITQKLVQEYMQRYPEREILASVEDNTIVNGDAILLQITINNLLENALKYSPKDKSICIMLAKKGPNALFSITDNGQGIPNNEKQNIFNRHYRLGNEATKKAKGTGLGLYLVKNIIFTHKGKIEVTDNPQGGSIFAFSIPLI